MVNSQVNKVTVQGVVINQCGEEKIVDADTVVLAMGAIPNNSLARRLRQIVPNLFEVGDCVRPSRIVDAINQAACVAREI